MKQEIIFPGGKHTFVPKRLFHGRKKMDAEVAKNNLLTFQSVMKGSKVTWGLMFGTLLGAIRESNLIEHDEDTDVFVFWEDKQEFLALLPMFLSSGFEVARFEDYLMSLIRDDEYIDFYFLKRRLFSRAMPGFSFGAKFFGDLDEIEMFDSVFPIPTNSEELLSRIYGADWRVPKLDSFAVAKEHYLKKLLKGRFPQTIELIRRVRAVARGGPR